MDVNAEEVKAQLDFLEKQKKTLQGMVTDIDKLIVDLKEKFVEANVNAFPFYAFYQRLATSSVQAGVGIDFHDAFITIDDDGLLLNDNRKDETTRLITHTRKADINNAQTFRFSYYNKPCALYFDPAHLTHMKLSLLFDNFADYLTKE